MADAAQITQWIEKLKKGELTEADLQQALDRAKEDTNSSTNQRILYLQTHTTDIEGPVIGMSIVEEGEVHEGPADPDDWPYQTVLDALNDGWRVIKFPELSLAYLEPDYGAMKWEFVLEK
jgi:hypothetical protein